MKLFSYSNKNKLILRKKYHNWIDAFVRGDFYKFWYENGKIKKEWHFPKIKEEYTCYIDKSFISKDNPKGERIEGIYKSWYTSGFKNEEKSYKNGFLDGISKKYDDFPSESYLLKEEVKYKNGEIVYRKKYLSVENLTNPINYLKYHSQPELDSLQLQVDMGEKEIGDKHPYRQIDSFFKNNSREIPELNKNLKEKIQQLPWEKLQFLETSKSIKENIQQLPLEKIREKYTYFKPMGKITKKEIIYNKNGLKNGLEKSFYDNGNVAEEIHWSNGIKDGLEKSFYDNRQLHKENKWEKGKFKPDRIYRTWHVNGKVKKEWQIKNGKREGYFKEWFGPLLQNYRELNPKGSYIKEINGKKERFGIPGKQHYITIDIDRLIQTAFEHFEDDYYARLGGKTMTKEQMKKQAQKAFDEEYPTSGGFEQKFFFKDDKEHGTCKIYGAYGKVKKESNYKKGKLDGIEKIFYESSLPEEDGVLFFEHIYKNDELNGLQKVYYKNGQLECETNFKNDKIVGIRKSWYKDGLLEYIGSRNNEGWNKTIFWHKNGQLKSEYSQLNNKLHGLYKSWFKNGTLKSINTYVLDNGSNHLSKMWDKEGLVVLSDCSGMGWKNPIKFQNTEIKIKKDENDDKYDYSEFLKEIKKFNKNKNDKSINELVKKIILEFYKEPKKFLKTYKSKLDILDKKEFKRLNS